MNNYHCLIFIMKQHSMNLICSCEQHQVSKTSIVHNTIFTIPIPCRPSISELKAQVISTAVCLLESLFFQSVFLSSLMIELCPLQASSSELWHQLVDHPQRGILQNQNRFLGASKSFLSLYTSQEYRFCHLEGEQLELESGWCLPWSFVAAVLVVGSKAGDESGLSLLFLPMALPKYNPLLSVQKETHHNKTESDSLP